MKVWGLTGSIGMGKSTAAKLLRRLGVYTHSADDEVAFQLSPSGKAFEIVALTFPQAWDKQKHKIDKQILSELLIKDENAKIKLEQILHPLVQHAQKEFVKRAKRMGAKHVVLDIPLLFETKAMSRVQKIITVSAPYFIQRMRVLSRPNFNEARFEALLKSQMPDILKQKYSDFKVKTGLGQADTLKQLKRILNNA